MPPTLASSPLHIQLPQNPSHLDCNNALCHFVLKFDHGISQAFPSNPLADSDLIFLWGCYTTHTSIQKHGFSTAVALLLQPHSNHALHLDFVSHFTLSQAINISLYWTNGLSANMDNIFCLWFCKENYIPLTINVCIFFWCFSCLLKYFSSSLESTFPTVLTWISK